MERKYSLKELRARHNYTHDDMAEKLGIARQSYHRWEKYPQNLKMSQLLQLAEILQVNLWEIKL
jgi:DNA-binding XRE family transcriptional regulator